VPYLRRAIATNAEDPPAILAQTWLMQLAAYAREEGLELMSLYAFYPHIQTALQLDNATWPVVEQMLNWWLEQHWQMLHEGQQDNLYQAQQLVQDAIHLEKAGHIRSSVEWVEWWLKVWRTFLQPENCGVGHEMTAFVDKPVPEVIHLAKGSIVYAPHKVEAWQIMVFWQQAQKAGLVRPSDEHRVISLYLTLFGQSLLRRQWARAQQGLWQALRFSFQPRAFGAWRDFIWLGIQYWRNGRLGSHS
jgi:hypothetical protein